MRTGRGNGRRAAAAAAWLLAMAAGAASVAAPSADRVLADAQKAQQDGNNAAAVELYGRFVAAAPQDDRVPWILVQIGDLQSQLGHQHEAMDAYARVGRDFPDAVEARMAKSRLTQLTQSVLDSARTRAANARSEDEKMQALWDLGAVHEWTGSPLEAASAYREIRQTASAKSWKQRAADRLAALVEERVKAEASGPPVPSAERWTGIAELAEGCEVWGRAVEYRLKLADLAKEPGERAAQQLKAAHDLQLAGRSDEALAICLKALDGGATGDPEEEAYRTAGLVYESRRQWGDAIRLYRRYMSSHAATETLPWAHLKLAQAYEHTADAADAVKAYAQLVAEHPGNPAAAEALLAMGRLHEARKDFDQAILAYQQVVDQFPNTAMATEARGDVQAAGVRKAEWEKIRQDLGHVSESYPARERREVR